MTWSIIARDPSTGDLAIAVATKFFAVGSRSGAGDPRQGAMVRSRPALDDHADPLAELERLEQVSRERWVHFRPFLPNHANPAGITDRELIDAGIARGLPARARARLERQGLRGKA